MSLFTPLLWILLISPKSEGKLIKIMLNEILYIEAVRSLNGNLVELIDGKTISAALNKKDELYQLLGIK